MYETRKTRNILNNKKKIPKISTPLNFIQTIRNNIRLNYLLIRLKMNIFFEEINCFWQITNIRVCY